MYSLYIEGENMAVLGCCGIEDIVELGRQIRYAIQQ